MIFELRYRTGETDQTSEQKKKKELKKVLLNIGGFGDYSLTTPGSSPASPHAPIQKAGDGFFFEAYNYISSTAGVGMTVVGGLATWYLLEQTSDIRYKAGKNLSKDLTAKKEELKKSLTELNDKGLSRKIDAVLTEKAKNGPDAVAIPTDEEAKAFRIRQSVIRAANRQSAYDELVQRQFEAFGSIGAKKKDALIRLPTEQEVDALLGSPIPNPDQAKIIIFNERVKAKVAELRSKIVDAAFESIEFPTTIKGWKTFNANAEELVFEAYNKALKSAGADIELTEDAKKGIVDALKTFGGDVDAVLKKNKGAAHYWRDAAIKDLKERPNFKAKAMRVALVLASLAVISYDLYNLIAPAFAKKIDLGSAGTPREYGATTPPAGAPAPVALAATPSAVLANSGYTLYGSQSHGLKPIEGNDDRSKLDVNNTKTYDLTVTFSDKTINYQLAFQHKNNSRAVNLDDKHMPFVGIQHNNAGEAPYFAYIGGGENVRLDGLPDPVVGHQYKLSLTINPKANNWTASVTDLTTNQTATSSHAEPLPPEWNTVVAKNPDNYRIYDCKEYK